MTSVFLTQSAFRGRNDDGSQTTATWIANANTNWSQDVDVAFRIRFVVRETNARTSNLARTIYFSRNSGAYAVVTTSTSFCKLVASATVADATATTQQLGTGTFVTGVFDSNGTVAAVSLNNNETEYEYCVQIVGADVANGDTFAFRVYNAGVALNSYTNTPTVTAVKATPDALTASNLTGGTIALGTPTIGQVHGLTANNLTGGTIVLGTSTLGQTHEITANNLTGGTPVLGTPVLGQSVALTANNLTLGTIALGTSTLGQEHGLTATSLVSGTIVLGTPTIGQTHGLFAQNSVLGVISFGTLTLGQVHGLTANNLTSGTAILGTPSVAQVHALTADNLVLGTIVLGSPNIEQEHDLTASNLVSGAVVLGTPTIGQVHEITASNLTLGTVVLGTPTAGTGGGTPVTYTDGYGGDVNTAIDTQVHGISTTFNYGGSGALNINSGTPGIWQLFKFDLSAIPEGATCNSAELFLYQTQGWETDSWTLYIYSILSGNGGWIAGNKDAVLAGSGEPCWNAKEADGSGGVTTAWAGSAGLSTAGTDYNSTAIGSISVDGYPGEGTEHIIELDAAVIETWFGSNDDNFGILAKVGGTDNFGRVASSSYVTTGYRPKLVVEYVTGGTPTDDLTGSNLTLGTVTLGTPSIGQVHEITASNLTLGTVVLGTPTAGTPVTYTDGYGGDVNSAIDTMLISANPTINYGAAVSFTTSTTKVLMRFNLSAVPEGAVCNSAKLVVYKTNAGGSLSGSWTVYSILAANGDWIEGVGVPGIALQGEPCWNAKEADGSGGVQEAWAGSAGMSTSGTDYNATAVGSKAMISSDPVGLYEIELDTDVIETWFGSNTDNHGIIFYGNVNIGSIASSDNSTTGYRPYLEVEYVGGGGGTDELTASGLTLSAPVLGSPTSYGTATEYVDGYGGDVNTAEDFLMSDGWMTRNGGTHSEYQLDPDGGQKAVLRFDLSAIPSDAFCFSAILHLYHTYEPEGGAEITASVYSVSQANGDWIEGTGNIEIALQGEPCWNAKEADGSEGVQTAWAGSAGMSTSGTDYEATPLGSVQVDPADAQGTEYQISLSTSRIEDWFGETNTNYGIVLFNTNGNGGPHLGSADNVTTGYRPKLVVHYIETSTSDDLTASNLTGGTIVFGTPTIGQIHDIDASGLVLGVPALDTPTVGQTHELTASGLVGGTITLGTPIVGQEHDLTANTLVLGAPVLGTPTLSENLPDVDNLDADDLVLVAPVLGTTVLGQEHGIIASNVVGGVISLGTPVIEQEHTLTADNLVLGVVSLGTPVIGQAHELTANNLTGGVIVGGTPVIGQAHEFVANNLVLGTIIFGAPAIGQVHGIVSSGLALAVPTLGQPTLSENLPNVDNLAANNLVLGSTTLGQPAVGQVHELISNSITLGVAVLGEPTIGQVQELDANSLVAGTVTLGTPSVAQSHGLVASSLTGGATLLGEPVIGQVHEITASNLALGALLSGEPSVGQTHELTGNNLPLSAPVLGTPTLMENLPDVVNLFADNMVGGVILLGTPSVGQEHNLTTDGLSATIVLGEPIIAQENELTASSLVAGTILLGTPSVQQIHVLGAEGIVSGGAVIGVPTIEQNHNLGTNTSTLGTITFGSPSMGQEHWLSSGSLVSGSVVFEEPTLTENVDELSAYSLVLAAPTVGAPVIYQIHALSADSLVSEIVLGVPTMDRAAWISPRERIYFIKSESRVLTIEDDRQYIIKRENREEKIT